MARTERDVEAYLEALGKHLERVDEGTFLIRMSQEAPPIAVQITERVVVLHLSIGLIGKPENKCSIFEHLLELNATELMYCAYGLKGQEIVLEAALELENLDMNELQAVLADMDLALARHVPVLREMSRR